MFSPNPRVLQTIAKAIGLALLVGLASCGRLPGGRPIFSAPDTLNSRYGDRSARVSGSLVIFVSDRRGSEDLYLYNIRSGSLMPMPGLNDLDRLPESPAISEDGRWIVFIGTRDRRQALYLYSRDAQQARELVPSQRYAVRNPTISADGQIIAVEVNRDRQWDIAIYRRDGQALPIGSNAAF
jgi:Tol biopolymer transport system component